MFQPLFVRPLTPVEREGLKQYSESPNKEQATRAGVIMLSAEGKTAAEINQARRSHPTNIKKWIRKFHSDGLQGISSKKRGPQGGARPNLTPPHIEDVLLL